MTPEYRHLIAVGRVLTRMGFKRVPTLETGRRYEKVVEIPWCFGKERTLAVRLGRTGPDGRRFNTVSHLVREEGGDWKQLTPSVRFETGVEMLSGIRHEQERTDHRMLMYGRSARWSGDVNARLRRPARERTKPDEDWVGRPPK